MRLITLVRPAFFALCFPAALGCGGDAATFSSDTPSDIPPSKGDEGPVCKPEGAFDGKPIPPIDAPPGEWSWVQVDGAVCRDGSPTGFGIRVAAKASDKLMIYLEGGGACFNGTTCAINPGSAGEAAFDAWKGTVGAGGIFSSENPDNPVSDWNMVYVPYCSGDIHAGNAAGVDIEGLLSPKDQQFVGYANIYLYLKRIIPTFPSLSKVLLTGVSAGGFGAAYNYDRVAQAFCPTPVVLIDDSGPPMADDYLAPCLQSHWRTLWKLGETTPSDCTTCAGADGGGIVSYVDYLSAKYPDRRLGLISSTKDSVISLFFGYGKDECKNLSGVATPVSGDVFAAGLNDLRDNHMKAKKAWASYYVDSTTHTYLMGPGFYTTTVQDKKLTQWVSDVVNEGTIEHVGP